MNSFEYIQPKDVKTAASALGAKWEEARIIAGGVDILGEIKDNLIEPQKLVDLKSIKDLHQIKIDKDGLNIGATVTLTEIEENKDIQKSWIALSQAAGSVGTPQIRNMGTIGGNLCQRPRCWYYRDEHTLCLKKGGNMCYAIDGINTYHAIFGEGPCHIIHPSDLAVALIALNAKIKIQNSQKIREIPLKDFYTMPDVDPMVETILKPNEFITEIIVPTPSSGTKSVFIKHRELDSHDFALVSAAVVLELKSGKCTKANIVLGGVAPVPWQSTDAEKILEGKEVSESSALQAAEKALANAKPMSLNAYKIPLTKSILKQAILSLTT